MKEDIYLLIENYQKDKINLDEYKSYINHVREYKGYVFKEIRDTKKFENEAKWLGKLLKYDYCIPEIVETYNNNTIITKKIEGNPIKDEDAKEHLYNIGKLIAKLHKLPINRANCNWKDMLLNEYSELKELAINVMEKNMFKEITDYLDYELENVKFNNLSIIHRDLRPENVLVNNNTYYLLDFESMCIGDTDYDFIRMLLLFNQKDTYNYTDFKNFIDGYKSINTYNFTNEKWILYSKYYAFRMYTRMLSGKVNRAEEFENYLKNIIQNKNNKISKWLEKYNKEELNMLKNKHPIIIQGAMEMELEELLKLVKIHKEEICNGFKFYIGELEDYPVIISETQIGVINASMATCIAIEKYKPSLIINQGIAGSHVDYIHRNDIVVGEKAVNINSFITGIKNKNEGSNPFEWQFDTRSIEIKGDENLINCAKNMNTTEYNLFYGILGGGDIFDREVDRIKWIQQKKNTLCEDNESIAVYTICDKFKVPCIGFRTITNNEVTQTEDDGATSTRKDIAKNANRMIFRQHDFSPAKISQMFTIDYVKNLIKTIK